MLLGKLRAEKISLIPLGRLIPLGELVTHEKIQSRRLRAGIVVERLVHIVERCVIASDHPFFLEGKAVDFRVRAGDSIRNNHGWNALKHEGILVAANEGGLFPHGVEYDRGAELT